jgi:adenine phosphoribosyltransferase
MEHLKSLIREVPDFPKPGINFFDITTLLKDPTGFKQTMDGMVAFFADKKPDLVVGMESRGFIFAPTVAYALGAGFAPIRKPKKLPSKVEFWEYELEYGTDRLEIHTDAIQEGQKVAIIDDVLATGGTAGAATRLVEKLGGRIVGLGFVIELDFLNGRKAFGKMGYDIHSLLHY